MHECPRRGIPYKKKIKREREKQHELPPWWVLIIHMFNWNKDRCKGTCVSRKNTREMIYKEPKINYDAVKLNVADTTSGGRCRPWT